MARDHARIQVAIWSDPDFRALNASAQRMYLVILSQPRLSYCGTLDYLPSRLAVLAADETADDVESAIKALEHARYVVVDRDTHELLVRTFVRHDGLLGSPNMVKAMLKDRATVLSEPLRHVLDDELRRAFQEDPRLPGWKGFKAADPGLYGEVSRKCSPKGSEKGSGQ
jgi:hypothetical protein